MARVIVSDPLAPEGYDMLRDRGHEAIDVTELDDDARAAELARAEGWVLRSGTTVSAEDLESAGNLKGIGRAGVGTDNVDLQAATQHGVAVFNAPTGNITSAAEQAWALMLAVARRVPEADAAMKQEDWARKRLKGTELAGKTILVIGLGRIGRMMAARAQAFEMTVLGHDPFVTSEAAKGFGVEWVDLKDGMPRADLVTIHTPLTPQTQDLLDEELLGVAKEGSIIVNAARGGLVDMDALHAGLESGRIGGAGIDVWPEEPPTDWRLAKHPRVVAAPHLGASTKEAQVKAATQAIGRLCDFLDSGDAGLAVNAQARIPDDLRPWAALAEALAGFGIQTLEGNLDEILLSASPGLDVEALKVHALVGALRPGTDQAVNGINAPGMASEKGWTVATKTLPEETLQYLRVHLRAGHGETIVEGTYTPHYGARITMVDRFDVDFRPHGRFLLTRHKDVPGVLARITALLAESKVNVASVSLARNQDDGTALAVIEVDGSIPVAARDGLRGLEAIQEAHRIRLPDA